MENLWIDSGVTVWKKAGTPSTFAQTTVVDTSFAPSDFSGAFASTATPATVTNILPFPRTHWKLAGPSGFTSLTPILSAAAVSPGSTGVDITWETNIPADSQVLYGTTLAYGMATILDSSLVTDHSVTLSGLNPGTQYRYQIQTTADGRKVTYNGTFTTLVVPVVSSVVIGALTQTGATIAWTTDQPADSQVEYIAS